jgi:hypothetical protein
MTAKSQSQRKQKKEAEPAKGNFPLVDEVSTYESHLLEWADRAGQFVLIEGRDVLGFYPSHEDAVEAGYDRVGCGPFLVKQILVHEPIYQLGRVEL